MLLAFESKARMSKRLKKAAELVAFFEFGVTQARCLYRCERGRDYTGSRSEGDLELDSHSAPPSGGPVPGQCAHLFVAAVRLLQQQYDLAPED